MSDFRIYNGFGIVPTKNYTAAGYDFYIPVIDGNDIETVDRVYSAFASSYKKSETDVRIISDKLYRTVLATLCAGVDIEDPESMDALSKLVSARIMDILHLYLALESSDTFNNAIDEDEKVSNFVESRLVWHCTGPAGIKVLPGDYVLFNTGLKLKFEPGTAGIFFNKSGKGTNGWDTRACVVDEDYAGYVHMSAAYDKSIKGGTVIYCGDKLMQLVIIKVEKTEVSTVTEEEYNLLQSDSRRGIKGFGSSDVKH